jgi:hypothetical protein
MVQNDLMRLEMKRLRDTLTVKKDELFSLENRKQQLIFSMEERKHEIAVHRWALITRCRMRCWLSKSCFVTGGGAGILSALTCVWRRTRSAGWWWS